VTAVAADVALSVEGVSKRFRIPLDRSSSLKHRLTHWRSASRYRTLEALHDINFDVPWGQFLGIIGHNGSGKSTLLKILSRIYQPDGGRLAINGHVSPFLELGVGFNPELTARENVFLSGAILGLSRAELRARIDEIIAFSELEEFVEQKLKNFSSGMQVRLAFALAIQADAGILLMDEVLAVGDASFQQKCFDVFARYKREGRTVVLVTHELGSVNLYCDRALLLDHGRLVADGPAADVTAQYRRAVGLVGGGDDREAPEVVRWGSREVVITSTRMTDERGVDDHHPMTGGFVRVEADYLIQSEDVTDFNCMLRISRSDGLVMWEASTAISRYAQVGQNQRGGAGTIRYDIARLPLLAGSYALTVELQERRGAGSFDHLENVVSFHVVDRGSRVGLMDPDGRWQVIPSADPSGATAAESRAHG
jgi:ABC-type polysaccharide/polyol phosphate transport system ATPase subunit